MHPLYVERVQRTGYISIDIDLFINLLSNWNFDSTSLIHTYHTKILCKAREKDINSSLVFLSCPKYDIRLNCRHINSVYGAKHCSRKHSDLSSGANLYWLLLYYTVTHTANEFNVDICSICCL